MRKYYIYILSFAFLIAIVLEKVIPDNIITIIYLVILTFFSGYNIFKKAFFDLKYRIIGIDLLVTIAVIGAFAIGDLFESAAVTYLFTLGNYLEIKSLEKTRSALKALMDLRPLQARVIRNGKEIVVDVDEVEIDEVVLIKQGEKIPVDGVIIEGKAAIDEQLLTGESIPIDKEVSDKVYSSTIVSSGFIKVITTQIGDDTAFSKILEIVEEAQDKKARTQKFIEKFSKYYTPMIILIAIVIFIITFDLRMAITMLVISCPGALVISTPVSIVSGIGASATHGILFKGGETIENLSKTDIIFFDKTGTLTIGKPVVKDIKSYIDEESLIKIAGISEKYSEHPLANAIVSYAYKKGIDINDNLNDFDIIIGMGIRFSYQEINYKIGNQKFIDVNLITDSIIKDIDFLYSLGQTVIILANEEKVLGLIGIADEIRENAKVIIRDLKKKGVKKIIMLTGDNEIVAKNIAMQLQIDEYYAGLLPLDKAEIVGEYNKNGNNTMFVGDGINDAPALLASKTGVAVGGVGKDIAMETADVVLMSEKIDLITTAIDISKKVKINIIENIVFALIVVIVLILGVVANIVNMSIGMFVHEMSVLIVIINAIRLLRYKKK